MFSNLIPLHNDLDRHTRPLPLHLRRPRKRHTPNTPRLRQPHGHRHRPLDTRRRRRARPSNPSSAPSSSPSTTIPELRSNWTTAQQWTTSSTPRKHCSSVPTEACIGMYSGARATKAFSNSARDVSRDHSDALDRAERMTTTAWHKATKQGRYKTKRAPRGSPRLHALRGALHRIPPPPPRPPRRTRRSHHAHRTGPRAEGPRDGHPLERSHRATTLPPMARRRPRHSSTTNRSSPSSPWASATPGTAHRATSPRAPSAPPSGTTASAPSSRRLELTVLIGSYAHRHYLDGRPRARACRRHRRELPRISPRLHRHAPSLHPRNRRWMKNNPSFYHDVIPELRARVQTLIN